MISRERLIGLPPVIPERCTLLVLGSLPGRASLAASRYYGHPRNQFWALLQGVTGEPLTSLDYVARIERLGARGIGLWDVIGSARRGSSLDGDIRDAVANPLRPLVERLPHLRAIGCNGALSARGASRALAGLDLPILALPSSSPAHTLPLAAKAQAWQALQSFILPPGQTGSGSDPTALGSDEEPGDQADHRQDENERRPEQLGQRAGSARPDAQDRDDVEDQDNDPENSVFHRG